MTCFHTHGQQQHKTVERGVLRPNSSPTGELQLHVTWLRGQLSAMILASVAAGRITIDAPSPSGPPWTAGHWIGPHAKVRTVISPNASILFLLDPLLAAAVFRVACKSDNCCSEAGFRHIIEQGKMKHCPQPCVKCMPACQSDRI